MISLRGAIVLSSPATLYAQGQVPSNEFWSIRIGDVIMIAAVLLAPVVALQVQRWLQTRREIRDRKLYIFRTLMATRASRLSLEHVAALNMIDLEFYGSGSKNKEVTRAWNLYRDHLNTPSGGHEDPQQQRWNEKGNELFTALLVKLGAVVDYDFDELLLKKGAYFPKWQGDLEDDQDDQFLLRKGLLRMLAGSLPLKMEVISFPFTVSDKEAEEQQRVRKLLIDYLEGRKPIPIIVVQPESEQVKDPPVQ